MEKSIINNKANKNDDNMPAKFSNGNTVYIFNQSISLFIIVIVNQKKKKRIRFGLIRKCEIII